MLWLIKRLFYGIELDKWKGHLTDATLNERVIAYSLSFSILALGIYPLMVTKYSQPLADQMAKDAKEHMSVSGVVAPTNIAKR
ncbi:MAG: hypothetical protein IPL73_08470 [Candidatus Obscuribacter sp.]|nr:hypothetical protein [Candidatus Obscuribacter sp.]